MSDQNFVTLAVTDGTEMRAYTAFPTTTGPVPGIILLQEAFGVNQHIRNVADRLAQAGYAVVAPELFHRTAAPGVEIPYSDFASAMPHYQAISVDGLTADVQAAHAWLQTQALVMADRIGSIGFCLGGRVSFLANAVLPLAAAVSKRFLAPWGVVLPDVLLMVLIGKVPLNGVPQGCAERRRPEPLTMLSAWGVTDAAE